MKKIELLAPAGSLEGLKAVINAGADAVYIGGSRFGARAYADNPDEAMLLEGLDFAHVRGKKVYLTVNTLLKEMEMEQLCDYLQPYYEHGVDGVLVQDFGVLKLLHESFPDLPLHASTQMTVTGPNWAELLKRYNVTRIVPARELSLAELKSIKDATGLEVEVFIHGALCVCYSGQCLYSSILGGRSGNRGRCAQPCRLLYLNDDRTGFNGKTSIVEQKAARHFLSPKDLNGIEEIPELIRAGMDSLKIEGRMKRPEYAAGVVSIYRKYIDLAYSGKPYHVEKSDQKKLYDLYNRSGFTDGYFHRHNGPEMMALVKHELTPKETEARHALYEEMGKRYIEENTCVPVNAKIEVFAGQPIHFLLKSGEIEAEVFGQEVQTAKNRPLSEERIAENIRKTGGTDFEMKNLSVRTDHNSFVPVSALNEVRREGLDAIKNKICASYRRSPVRTISATEEKWHGLESEKNAAADPHVQEQEKEKNDCGLKLSVLVSARDQLEAVSSSEGVEKIIAESYLFHGRDWEERLITCVNLCHRAGKKLFIAMPYIDRQGSDEKELKREASLLIERGLDGFLIRNPETLAWVINSELTEYAQADAGLYTFNSKAQELLYDLGIRKDTAPIELNRRELSHRNNRNSELIVYGRIPLMVTVQCLEKNVNGCTRKNASHVLTDRMGAKFPVKCVCDFCYNMVYNSVPLSLLGEFDEISKMNFSGMRLQFTSETPEQMRKIIAMASHNLIYGKSDDLEGEHTKGHFSRGVE